ncbi:MAG: HAD family hydrolase [Geminicoccaceae bacterium]
MTQRPVIVFDLGAVLIDWNPRHLYRKLFDDEAEMEAFFRDICTPEWNAEQDRGRSWDDAVALLSADHPEHKSLIEAYRDRWEEMLAGPIYGTVDILERLKEDGYEVHALTNWSAETFPIARARYGFLERFETILVSGEEGMKKPDPAIFHLLLERIGYPAQRCIFIDDSAKNIEAASDLGFDSILFEGPDLLQDALSARGV